MAWNNKTATILIRINIFAIYAPINLLGMVFFFFLGILSLFYVVEVREVKGRGSLEGQNNREQIHNVLQFQNNDVTTSNYTLNIYSGL